MTKAAGLASFQQFHGSRTSQLPEDMGSGLAWGDFDNDGYEDLFVVSGGGALNLPDSQLAPSMLYRNLGNGRFERVEDFPETRIRGMGAAWGDYNNDGWLDLVRRWYLETFAEGKINLTQMDSASEVTLMYSTTRRELAMWYWRMWKKKLWKFHAALLVTSIAVVVLTAGRWPPSVMDILRGIAVAGAVIASLILFPQIMFKPEVRTLSFDKNGLRTKIGKKSGTVSWKKIESITDSEGTIVISRKNLNAFLVPQRAFQSDQERTSVLSAIRAWMDGWIWHADKGLTPRPTDQTISSMPPASKLRNR